MFNKFHVMFRFIIHTHKYMVIPMCSVGIHHLKKHITDLTVYIGQIFLLFSECNLDETHSQFCFFPKVKGINLQLVEARRKSSD